MDDFSNNLICRHTFETQVLIDTYPPKLSNTRKKLLYSTTCPPRTTHKGELIFSRWQAPELPKIFPHHQVELEVKESYFGYEPSADNTYLEWSLNFAHSDVFCAYGSTVFAQDEMQVAEHPALASLREALLDQGIR
jgi:hypothetical protein